MDTQTLKQQIIDIEGKRSFLVELLADTNLGNLKTDVNQALVELDDLLAEFERTFPDASSLDRPNN